MQARASLLLGFMTIVWQSQLNANDYWPLGTNVCRGSWTYEQPTACAHSSHGKDQKKPIYETGGICGYNDKANSCWHGDKFSRNTRSSRQHLSRKDHGWHAHELKTHCQSLAMTTQVKNHEWIKSTSVIDIVNGRRCYKRDWKKKCVKWHIDVEFTCSFSVHKEKYEANAKECGTAADLESPKKCIVNHEYKVAVSDKCPKVPGSTGEGIDISSIMEKPFHGNFSCSTGDHLPSTTQPETQKKFQFLQSRLESSKDINDADYSHILDSMRLLFEEKADWLTNSQRFDSNRILKTQVTSNLDKLPVRLFDTQRDCASSIDGSFRWHCLNSTYEMRELRFAAKDYLSNYDITYQFTCNIASEAPIVKVSRGERSNFLAAQPKKVNQTLTITDFVSDLKLSFFIDRHAKITDDCVFDLIAFEPVLDIDRVEAKERSFKERYDQLKSNIKLVTDNLLSPIPLDIIEEIKADLEIEISAEVGNCTSLETIEEIGSLCPNTLDPQLLCQMSTATGNRELFEALRGIKQNACMLSELMTVMPTIEQCLDEGRTDCLIDMQKLLKRLEQEMQALQSEASNLASYLEKWENDERASVVIRNLQALFDK